MSNPTISSGAVTLLAPNTDFHREAHNHQIAVGVTSEIKAVGCANDAGIAADLARSDHTHQGITSVQVGDSGTPRYGVLEFKAGNNINIADSTVTACSPIFTISNYITCGYLYSTVTGTIAAGTVATFDNVGPSYNMTNTTTGLIPPITGLYQFSYSVRGAINEPTGTHIPTPLIFELYDSTTSTSLVGTNYASQLNNETTYTDNPTSLSVTMSINATGVIYLLAGDNIGLRNTTVRSADNTLIDVSINGRVSPIGAPNNTKPFAINASLYLQFLAPLLVT